MTDETPPTTVQPISSEAARERLHAAIREHLGENWEDDPDGWTIVESADFHARLNKGSRNLDFYVDLLGDVRVEESGLDAAQEYGRLLAMMFLIGSIFIAIIIARVAGYF